VAIKTPKDRIGNNMTLEQKFKDLAAENAPGQEGRKTEIDLAALRRGGPILGDVVDFSHGDVDAFPPTPAAFDAWSQGFAAGGQQAYTEYRGSAPIRERLAQRLGTFTGKAVDGEDGMIVTPGTQGALFLALGATVTTGTKVAVVEPDYFANRKLVRFFNGDVVPIQLTYDENSTQRGPDLSQLEEAFHSGVEVMVFSTPNNPTGLVYSGDVIERIATLAATHNVTLIVDQLYSRLLYRGERYAHLRSCDVVPDNLITIMGPSKTESLSGFRLGVAFGTPALITRMERLQALVSLRAAGYNQAVLDTWFCEPDGWITDRIAQHTAIRDDLLGIFRARGLVTATPQAGSYLFPRLPKLAVAPNAFVSLLRDQADVTVTLGDEFGPTSADSIRLNFSQDHDTACDAAKRLVAMVERYQA
jgi:aspartate/methionine/tyrosine aminotransferase